MPPKDLEKIIFAGVDRHAVTELCGRLRLAVGVVARLRGPGGCPWDREQDHLTLRPYVIEEAYEVLDVLDRYRARQDPKAVAQATPHEAAVPANGAFVPADAKLLCEELGDLLLQVVLHAQLCHERGEFSIGDVAEAMARKLVSRHPHVFGDVQVAGSDEVLANWESLKKKEGRKGLLDGLPKGLPSLQRAARIGEKAHRVGFDWKDWKGAWGKSEEELEELREAVESGDAAAIEHEIGDLFFSLCHLARHLKIQPEDAHRKAIARFEGRFRKMESAFETEGKDLHTATPEELDAAWEKVKRGS